MDYHHVIEAVGIVFIGLVLYSYTYRWFQPRRWLGPRWRSPLNGLVFGGLAVALMVSRIQVGDGVFIDARALPVALIGLVEGAPAAFIAAVAAAGYRSFLGGPGAPAGVLGILAIGVAAWLVHAWARRGQRVRAHHAFVLGVIVFVLTSASFLLLGTRGLTLFGSGWLPLLVMSVLGVGFFARLFADVAESQAAEAARREAAELRSVTLLARAAAHEINNPLNIVLGGLAIVAKRLPPETDEARWITEATTGARRIKDIVAHMNTITQLQTVDTRGALPPMLDIRKSAT